MAEKVLEKNKVKWVPIPEKVVKEVGLRTGSYVEVTDDGYHIILTPIEEEFTEAEWEKLRILVTKKKGKTYKSFRGVKKHLQKLKSGI